jgi:phosphonopyruvate decarboxylase
MIQAGAFIGAARARGIDFYTGVPCSYLKPFINYVIDARGLDYLGAANEGDAVAIAAGAELGGRRAVVMFQNSGLGNAVNPLTSLTHIFHIPMLLIVTLRGEPGGAADEPQHELMGVITTEQLELMQIPWEFFPDAEDDIDETLARAQDHMSEFGRPYALVMRKGAVAPHALTRAPEARPLAAPPVPTMPAGGMAPTRSAALAAVQRAVGSGDLVVATTGYMGRELYALDDRPNQLYMVGSMGCAVSLGLGLALARPERRVIVLDGDGAALMRLGALATVGTRRPANLIHVVLDNAMHESTGGQATVSDSIDFCGIAGGCGYPRLARPADTEALADALSQGGDGPVFVHMKIAPGVPEGLPRPDITPRDVAARFRRFVQDGK